MKRYLRGALAVLTAGVLAVAPSVTVMAANNITYFGEDQSANELLVFPGDSFTGVSPIEMVDGTPVGDGNGNWTNDSDEGTVYQAVALEAEPVSGDAGTGIAGTQMLEVGHVLKVVGGTFALQGDQAGDLTEERKYHPADENEFANIAIGETGYFYQNVSVGYFTDGETLNLTPEAAPEGMQFDHWEITPNDKGYTVDAPAAEGEPYTFTMKSEGVELKAVYAAAAVETEAPTEVQTEAPTQTEAPVETDAPAAEDSNGDGVIDVNDTPVDGAEATGEIADAQGADPAVTDTIADGAALTGESAADAQAEGAPTEVTITVEGGTFEDGSTTSNFAGGEQVTVTANAVEGENFTGWTTSDDSVVTMFGANLNDSTLSFPAPLEEDFTLTANYAPASLDTVDQGTDAANADAVAEDGGEIQNVENAAEAHTITVNYGTSDKASANANDTVTVTADAAAEGQRFKEWSVTGADGILNDENKKTTPLTFTMPDANVEFTANYEPIPTYAVVVNGGTGASNYTKDATVTITAQVPEGKQFAGWTVDTGNATLADANAATTTFAMPEAAVTVTANFTDIPTYAVVVNGGTGASNYTKDATVTITAQVPEGKQFAGWTVNSGNVTLADANAASTTFVMPEAAVTVTANFTDIPAATYNVTVVDGTGSGTYKEGDVVSIKANTGADGSTFDGWAVTKGSVTLANENASETTFTMPAGDVTIEAAYVATLVTLTVDNGKGGGDYDEGEKVTVTADYPATGKEFDNWTVVSGDAKFADASAYTATVTMGSDDAEVKANYKNGPQTSENGIDGITEGQEFLVGKTINFTAFGGGMSNTNPNPGDYRYRPTGYQIGDHAGSFTDGYSVSFAVSATGTYSVTVTYTKEVWDGSNWTTTNETDSKTVNFRVVTTLSVQTGDDTPIGLILGVAGGALALIVILVIVLVMRRRKD